MAEAKSGKKTNARAKSASDRKRKSTQTDQSNDSPPNDWAQTVLNQLVEAQKTWFENASQQNAMLLDTVNKLSEMRQKAPTEALSDWVKQGIESLLEAQKHWSEITAQQSEQILQTVRTTANLSVSDLTATDKKSSQVIESLVKMRAAWLDFIADQNSRLVNSMKDNLKIDNSSPVSALADFANQAVNNYIEVQKRWLDVAIKLPFPVSADEDKK